MHATVYPIKINVNQLQTLVVLPEKPRLFVTDLYTTNLYEFISQVVYNTRSRVVLICFSIDSEYQNNNLSVRFLNSKTIEFCGIF